MVNCIYYKDGVCMNRKCDFYDLICQYDICDKSIEQYYMCGDKFE